MCVPVHRESSGGRSSRTSIYSASPDQVFQLLPENMHHNNVVDVKERKKQNLLHNASMLDSEVSGQTLEGIAVSSVIWDLWSRLHQIHGWPRLLGEF